MKFWLDMDGTIADLYGVEGWLDYLKGEDVTPYLKARGLGNLALVARYLNKAQKNGHEVGVITWTSKGGTADYNKRVAAAKLTWLARHMGSVNWDMVKVVPYGTDKLAATGGGVLFDDEEPNRKAWGEGAHTPAEMVEVLKKVLKRG